MATQDKRVAENRMESVAARPEIDHIESFGIPKRQIF